LQRTTDEGRPLSLVHCDKQLPGNTWQWATDNGRLTTDKNPGGSMNSASEHEHTEGGVKVFLVVWFWLLALTGVEVFLGYKAFEVKIMIVLLMGLSVIKASLIIAYFMHLRYEKPSMAATLMPALVMVILLMFMVFPDSFRLLAMRPH
jgi:cytochrome c oxidase subunit 4